MRKLTLPLILTGLALLLVHAQGQGFGRYTIPDEDPSAFKIITPPLLDEAVRKIDRLRSDLETIKNPRERRAQLAAILNICQEELDREVNATGVVAMYEGAAREDGRREARRWLGAYNALEDRVRSLGKEGLELYEELFGKRAANLLDQAALARDARAILDVNKRFGLTKAGVRAAVLLAQMEWEQGHLGVAARALERALQFREVHTPQAEADLTAWLSRCYRELGERANLAQLRLWAKPLTDLSVRVGDASVKLAELLSEDYRAARDATNDTLERQSVYWPGGNYANTGISALPASPGKVAWTQTLPRLEAEWWPSRFMQYPSPIVPPYLPVSDGAMLYVNNGDSLCAYDVLTGGKRTGEPVWRCKPFPNSRETFWRTAEPDPALILPVSVWRQTVFAPLENPLREPIHRRSADNRFGLYAHYPQARRALCAMDCETGRLLWKIGGQYEGSEFDQTSFGPAIVHEGVLYAVGTRVPSIADVFLFALNPQDGAVLWSMRLCYGQQEVTMFGRPARWPFTSLPAIAGGQLFLCTNLGGVVAVNLERRVLSWIAKYDYMARPMTSNIWTYYRPVTWYNSPTVYAEVGGDGYVLAAPADSQALFCFNARTGEQVWKLERARLNADYNEYDESRAPLAQARALVGVRNNTAIVAGGTSLYTLDVTSGRISRAVRVIADLGDGRSRASELQGRPALAGNKLYWPGSAGISAIDMDTFQTGATVPAFGNNVAGLSVFCQQGILFTVAGNDYSLGNALISARFDGQLLLTDARLQAAQMPDNAEVALRYGLLNLRMGDKNEARKWLEKAFNLASGAKTDARVRAQAGRTLVSLTLDAADALIDKRSYAEALTQADAAAQYATVPAQQTEIFVRRELCLVKLGNRERLARVYEEIIDQDPAFGVGSDPEIPARYYATIMLARLETTLPGGRERALGLFESLLVAPESLRFERLSLRQVGINGMAELLSVSRDLYASREQQAAALLKGDRESWRRVLREFPLSEAADEAALKLASAFMRESKPRDAVAMLQVALDEAGQRKRKGELLAVLALALHRGGEPLRARLVARRVLRDFPSGELELDGVRRKFSEWLAPLLESREGAERTPPAKISRAPVELWNEEWPAPTRMGYLYVPPQPSIGKTPSFLTLRSTGDNPLRCVNARNGEELWKGGRQTLSALNNATRIGDNLLLEFTRGVALYSESGQERWVFSTNATPQNISAQDGMVLMTLPGDGTRRNVCRVVSLDFATGGVIWDVQLEATEIVWARACTQGVLLVSSNGREDFLRLLDAESGELVRTLKLERLTSRHMLCKPLLTEQGVHVLDDRGDITTYAPDTFAMSSRVVSMQARPRRFALTSFGLLVVGYPGAAMCNVATQKVVWRTPYKSDEVVMDLAIAGDVLVLGLTERYETSRLLGLALEDGRQVFSLPVAGPEADDRVRLRCCLELQDGAAFGFAVSGMDAGMTVLRGFKLLVVNKQGQAQLDWFTTSEAKSEIMQIAAIDDYILMTAGRTSYCFGAKE